MTIGKGMIELSDIQKNIYKIGRALNYTLPEINKKISGLPEYNLAQLMSLLTELKKEQHGK